MLRKTLFRLTLTGVAAIGAVNLAHAATVTGPYIGGQLGWGATHAGLNDLPGKPSVNAIVNDINDPNTQWFNYSASHSSSTGGLVGRIFVGYQFNPNWAAELGYIKFKDEHFKGSYIGSGVNTSHVDDWVDVNYAYKGVVKEHAVDLVGKGILPLENGFDLYGKLGIAYVQQTAARTEAPADSSTYTGEPYPGKRTVDTNKLLPEFGVGVSYDITPNVPVDLSWTHIQKTSGTIESADFVSLGLAYKFNA